MNVRELSKKVGKLLENDEKFKEALRIVQKNASGKIFLIGGSVYKNVAHIIYDTPLANADFDFIVEKRRKKISLPPDWNLQTNSFGNFKFLSNFNIDFVPLYKVRWIEERKLKATLRNYLLHTPFTIQSIAYDIRNKKLIGNIGLNAIFNKTVGVLDRVEADFNSQRTNLSIKTLMKNKARNLGFKVII